MSHTITKNQTGEAIIDGTISALDLKTESSWAAARLSKDFKIPGFRPGKAPYDIVKKEIGEAKILEEAADKLVTDKLNEIIKKENLEIAGQPKIEVKKLAAGNDLIFTALVPLIPKVTLPDFSKIEVKSEEIKVDEEKVGQSIEQLQQMRTKEVREKRHSEKGDKVEVDFEVKVEGKVIEGGKAEKFSVVIGENQMIPGFEEKLIGLKEGEEKEFNLEFPKNYAEHLAGKKAEFKVKLHGVFKRELPDANDEFAKSCGAKNLDDLKNKIKENLKKEAEAKAKEKQEVEIIEKATGAASFGAIPESLIKSEQHNMLHELEAQITQSGGKFEDYLLHAKKTKEELRESFKDNAAKRVKTQILFRQIIKDNKIEPDKNKVEEEIKKAELMYASAPEMAEKIKSPDYRRYVEMSVLNRQVIEWVKRHATHST
ncbi:trigger factor [Candidatus Falkowbacteria bacterium]|nr:trigger factor [Candidatus Falkowbacteria bacterium]